MTSTQRADLLIGDMLGRIHQLIADHDVTYEEFQTVKQWLIDVGQAGEWPLFLDVFVESAVEQQVFGERAGTQGTILGPYHLPDAPLLEGIGDLPRRPDEDGELVVVDGTVTDDDGAPLAGVVLDVWHADAKGLYSGFDPSLPAGILRGKVTTDAEGRYTYRTVLPAPYTIPEDGPTGAMVHAADWSPWRPAHIHVIVGADGYTPLVTQLYIDSSEYLDNDVAKAVKDDLIVHPSRRDDGTLGITYDFRLARERQPAAV